MIYSLDTISNVVIADLSARELNALIKQAYTKAADLLERIDRTAIGSAEVIDVSGTGSTPRLIGSVESFGHLANFAGYFTVTTTGNRRDRLDDIVAAWFGRAVGCARACERRDNAIAGVAATLYRQLAAAGLDPRVMYSDGSALATEVVARKLVDLAVDRVRYLHDGDLDNLKSAALAMVPADIFTV